MSELNTIQTHVALGDRQLYRIGFGSMRITGAGVWGQPNDPAHCLELLRRLPELGVNFIDTADSYGPNVSEELIRDALHLYKGLTIATKAGLTRQGPNLWAPVGRPEYLRQSLLMSLRRLNLEQIDLWQLHRIDPKVPRDEQFQAVAEFQNEGLIKHIGLSEVNVEDIKEAQKYFKVDTVQNQFNLLNRQYEQELDYCTANNVIFIPWYPLAKNALAGKLDTLGLAAQKYEATPNQIAIAWLLKRSPMILPIPGTSKVKHFEENMQAMNIHLADEDFELLANAYKALA
ncbi:Predicted oxidoreductase [Methylophilus rhizosphaerae]|uniref:Predicted oxidoreductase n=1 Tax=Methylophilus rhizosphaerae TaxID=492660 RepID=A0A1G9AZK3_9PROT|nr:aldo/keto reductase [Methylophilus rhizosphaerae]SDK32120.1 Predicted oxidoreductase [Methylophilus rhizosphaerae]